jgi:hypothetical protein
LWQKEKQYLGIASTDDGRQIDRSETQSKKALSPSRERRGRGSKDKLERFLQYKKQDLQIVSTDEGMQID